MNSVVQSSNNKNKVNIVASFFDFKTSFSAYLTVVIRVMEGRLLVTTSILLGSYRSVGGCAAACPNC